MCGNCNIRKFVDTALDGFIEKLDLEAVYHRVEGQKIKCGFWP
jgi:hypothetical protein